MMQPSRKRPWLIWCLFWLAFNVGFFVVGLMRGSMTSIIIQASCFALNIYNYKLWSRNYATWERWEKERYAECR